MLAKHDLPSINPCWLGLIPWLCCPCHIVPLTTDYSHFCPVLDKLFLSLKYVLNASKEMRGKKLDTKDCAFSKRWEHGTKICALFFVLPWCTCCSDYVHQVSFKYLRVIDGWTDWWIQIWVHICAYRIIHNSSGHYYHTISHEYIIYTWFYLMQRQKN